MSLTFDELHSLNVLVMSNYSVYFLLENNGLNVNCSVYSLTSGSLKYLSDNGWLQNITLDFLPAYYVTNCSMEGLRLQIFSLEVNATDVSQWMLDYLNSPYNVADNGDLFIALLFMILGLCVLVWMLLLLFILLPKHKRKPILTQLATLIYLVVVTILLSQITEGATDEYYADSLDMVSILAMVNSRKKYPIALIVLQLVTNLAFLQLVIKMTKQRYKRISGGVGAVLLVIYLVLSCISVATTTDYVSLLDTPKLFYTTFKASVKVAWLIWFGITLAYHTLAGTASAPRQVSYLRKLAPLAFLTWFMVTLHVVITILTVTLWRDRWLVSSWIAFLPYLLEMYILTISWEWFYSIRHLELQLELVGMLGRRISLDDVMSFSHAGYTRNTTLRGRYAFMKDWFLGNNLPSTQGKDTASNGSVTAVPTSSQSPIGEDTGNSQGSAREHEPTARDDNSDDDEDNDDGDDVSYEVHYLEDDELWRNEIINDQTAADAPQEGTSAGHANNEQLPPFQPHPGYNRDDYWDEK